MALALHTLSPPPCKRSHLPRCLRQPVEPGRHRRRRSAQHWFQQCRDCRLRGFEAAASLEDPSPTDLLVSAVDAAGAEAEADACCLLRGLRPAMSAGHTSAMLPAVLQRLRAGRKRGSSRRVGATALEAQQLRQLLQHLLDAGASETQLAHFVTSQADVPAKKSVLGRCSPSKHRRYLYLSVARVGCRCHAVWSSCQAVFSCLTAKSCRLTR